MGLLGGILHTSEALQWRYCHVEYLSKYPRQRRYFVTSDGANGPLVTYTDMSSIRVGHVEVPDLWVDIDTESSLTVQEVINLSGMLPRDGTPVNCYLTSGVVFDQPSVLPGQSVIIGTRPPSSGKRQMLIDPKVHYLTVRWDKRSGRSLTGSGILEDRGTLWVPGVGKGSDIRAVEISRRENSKGKVHAQGYRIRGDSMPYFRNDLVRVFSAGENKFLLFDPQNNDLSIPVTVVNKSYQKMRQRELSFGWKFVWTLRVLNFDSEQRRVLAKVEISHMQ